MTDDNVKEITKLEKYLTNHKDADYVIMLRNSSVEQLKTRIQEQALYKQETITAKNNDEGLKEARAKAREMAAPYNESIRMNDKISRFISLLIEESGK